MHVSVDEGKEFAISCSVLGLQSMTYKYLNYHFSSEIITHSILWNTGTQAMDCTGSSSRS